jgi:FixJ family two-component response regulator
VARELLIAVIDDDESFRTALVESLTSQVYGVRGFASAEEYVAADGGCSCDCVVTDVNMPGMSGLDLKRLLVSRSCGVPVIMITAQAEPALDAEANVSGAVCLLRKPFESKSLIVPLKKALAV